MRSAIARAAAARMSPSRDPCWMSVGAVI